MMYYLNDVDEGGETVFPAAGDARYSSEKSYQRVRNVTNIPLKKMLSIEIPLFILSTGKEFTLL